MSPLLAETSALSTEALAGGAIVGMDGTVLHVGRLSLNQWTALARLSMTAVQKLPADRAPEIRAIMDKVQGGKGKAKLSLRAAVNKMTPEQLAGTMLTSLLPLLDEATVNELFAIVTRQPAEWCGEQLGLDEVLQIVVAALTHNPPERFAQLFRQAGAALSSQSSPSKHSMERAN